MNKPVAQKAKLWAGALPVHGVITFGPLRGWRYAFVQFIRIENTVAMDARCTEPSWPFQQTVRFRLDKDPIYVEAVSGERAKRLDANALIERCLQDGVAPSPFEPH